MVMMLKTGRDPDKGCVNLNNTDVFFICGRQGGPCSDAMVWGVCARSTLFAQTNLIQYLGKSIYSNDGKIM